MEKKKIVFKVNASSLVDLKAELYRKQESFKQEKIHQEQGLPTQRLPIKKPGFWNKQNVGVAERSEKDQKEKTEEELTLDKAREKLEEKAKLYDQMEKGGLPGEEVEEMFLVDFTQKFLNKQRDAVVQRGLREQGEVVEGPDEGASRARHPNGLEEEEELAKDEDIPAPSNPSEEWVDFVDSLGRSRRCLRKDLRDLQEMDRKLAGSRGPVAGERTLLSEDMRKEMERERWEKEQEELRAQPIGPIHYEHLREHEVRDLGVGYFAFSKDELKRKRQMDTLDMLRDQTLDQRSKREKLKEKRQAVLEARLERVRQRKGKKPGTDGPEGGETLDGEHVRAGSEPAEDVLQPGPSAGKVEVVVQVRRDTKKGEMPRVREWDKGKDFMLQDWQKGHGSQQRLPRDRPAEFAPPTTYFSGNKAGTIPSSERLPRMATQGPRTSDSSQHTPAQPPTQLDEMLAFYKQSNK